MLSDKEMIDDIIATLDGSIRNGVGHLDITVEDGKPSQEIETFGCNLCSRVDAPPKVPSLSKQNSNQ